VYPNFRTYQLAKDLYQNIQVLKLPSEQKSQILRSSLSVVLNLAEGSAKRSKKDQKRFFEIALASLRESQAILDINQTKILIKKADILGAHLYKLLMA
jgi:four helix bundle protein